MSMLHFLVKRGISEIIPIVGKKLHQLFDSPELQQKPRKVPDTRKFTPEQKAYIRNVYKRWKDERDQAFTFKSQRELVAYLNSELNLDKGVTAYARIWTPSRKSPTTDHKESQ